MGQSVRNHFLLFLSFGLLLGVLAGCASHPPAVPPGPSPQPSLLTSVSPLPFMGFAVQVGAFARVENAAALSTRLTKAGLAAYYYRNRNGLYRVRFGNYPRPEAARAVAERLRRQGMIEVFEVVRPASYPAVRYRGQEEALRRELVRVARQFIGVPYAWGDASPVRGFDCSGLAMMVYQLIGLDLPRVAREQMRRGRAVGQAELKPGDLVFFSSGPRGEASHVGIYQGDGLFIHAPGSGKTVSAARLSSPYFQRHFVAARDYLR